MPWPHRRRIESRGRTAGRRNLAWLALGAALAMPALTSACRRPELGKQLAVETARLQGVLSGKPAADPVWREAKPRLAASLERVRGDLAAGRPALALEELGEARGSLRTLETAVEVRGAPGGGGAALAAAWNKTSRELAAAGQAARTRDWARFPAAVRAVGETAEGRTAPLLAASRAYAGVTSPEAGFYYLGEARAAAELASFCYGLDAVRQGAPLPPRSIAPELRQLQDRTQTLFQPPRSSALHGRFIRLNATLKLAGELDAAGLHTGAAYQYLDAVEQLGLIAGAPPAPAAPGARGASVERLRRALAGRAARLRRSPQDESLTELFVERAAALLAGRGGAEPSEEARQQAAVILVDVLPAWSALKQATVPPLPPAGGAPPVAVTLLRWPYT